MIPTPTPASGEAKCCCVCGKPVEAGSVLYDGRPHHGGCPLPKDHPCAPKPIPAPGSDATTTDGRFMSGDGYGGERM